LAVDQGRRRRDGAAVLSAVCLLAFVACLVRVGRDEMILCRLYLPVLPLAMVLAAERLASAPPRWARAATFTVCATGIAFAVGNLNIARYLYLGDRSYLAMARELTRRARPGDRVVFQDLGRAPYEALALRFTDPL